MLKRNLALGLALSVVVACGGIAAMPTGGGADASDEPVAQEASMSADGTADAEAGRAADVAAIPDAVSEDGLVSLEDVLEGTSDVTLDGERDSAGGGCVDMGDVQPCLGLGTIGTVGKATWLCEAGSPPDVKCASLSSLYTFFDAGDAAAEYAGVWCCPS